MLAFGIASSLYAFTLFISSSYVYRMYLFSPLAYNSQPYSFRTMKIIMRKPNFLGRGVNYETSPERLEKTVSGMGQGQRVLANLREDGGKRFYFVDWDVLKVSNRKVWRAFHETVPWVQYKQVK